eukprot:6461416-Amphidinium_carterae.1
MEGLAWRGMGLVGGGGGAAVATEVGTGHGSLQLLSCGLRQHSSDKLQQAFGLENCTNKKQSRRGAAPKPHLSN